MLSKMGLVRIELWDGDIVSEENIGPQGFRPENIGSYKVDVVSSNCHLRRGHDSRKPWTPQSQLQSLPTLVFNCSDSMQTRAQLQAYCEECCLPLFDSRMAAERLEIWTMLPEPASQKAYKQSLFPDEEADQEPCTAKATVYCASLCAALLCAQAKRWMFLPTPELKVSMDLRLMTGQVTPQPEEEYDDS